MYTHTNMKNMLERALYCRVSLDTYWYLSISLVCFCRADAAFVSDSFAVWIFTARSANTNRRCCDSSHHCCHRAAPFSPFSTYRFIRSRYLASQFHMHLSLAAENHSNVRGMGVLANGLNDWVRKRNDVKPERWNDVDLKQENTKEICFICSVQKLTMEIVKLPWQANAKKLGIFCLSTSQNLQWEVVLGVFVGTRVALLEDGCMWLYSNESYSRELQHHLDEFKIKSV